MSFLLALASGFFVGFFLPTRVMVLCIVPVGAVAAQYAAHAIFDEAFSWLGALLNLAIAYPTALSINRFMHD